MKLTTLVVALSLTGVAMASGQAPVVSLAQAQGQESVDERISRLERAFEARQQGQAQILQQLSALQRELSELRGITEEHAHQLEQILERQRDLYQEIDRRIGEVRSGSGTTSTPSAPTGGPTVSGPTGESTAYDRAIRLVLEERRYDRAIPEFESFIANHPDSPYLSNAHYWLGQLYFVQSDFSEARTHFTKVINDFADSNKRADCMLKLGMIEKAEGNTRRARDLFQRVRSEYPNSTEAGMAQRELESLEG
ncbi:MAG: tol-pal system protein YbgF [Idiomarina sp.]|nr:tol-pal system protein YbgF [Idiomarina sp.]